MKGLFRILPLISVAAVIFGCASKVPKQVFHAGEEAPPDFLSGPAAMLLTNLDGFSATVAVYAPWSGVGKSTVSGDLLEREGRLIFQPSTGGKKKKSLVQGGMFFIWDETTHSGWVLSDPLQAYAPMSSSIRGTNVVWNTDAATQEEANGHPCRRVEAVVQCDDGTSTRFTVWQAEDEKRLPARIQCVAGPRQFTLNFSDIRVELPSPELFTPPDGFSKYPTPVALMNQLIIRQTELIKSSRNRPEEDTSSSPGIPNWRVGQPQ
ncbi:MAG TPA: hypothetical protein VH595_08850 [Verrucomicrobiae bacterium]|jgi:hypothetical protein|nr:hypothetical protein [Verrucomicrobiae bacterium]